MNIYYNFKSAQSSLNNLPTLIAVGSFDGVHKGHRLLIDQMNQIAKDRQLIPFVITFWPHPKQVLSGNCKLLSSFEEKLFLLNEAGVTNVLIINFTEEFSNISHSEFTSKYLIESLGAKAIILSDDHHFGNDRKGSNETIQNSELEIITLPRFENISSTAIRNAIESGDLKTAHNLLAERYLILEPIDYSIKIMPETIDKEYVRMGEARACND